MASAFVTSVPYTYGEAVTYYAVCELDLRRRQPADLHVSAAQPLAASAVRVS